MSLVAIFVKLTFSLPRHSSPTTPPLKDLPTSQEEDALNALRHAEQHVNELRAQQEEALRALHVAQQQLEEQAAGLARTSSERDEVCQQWCHMSQEESATHTHAMTPRR